MDKKIHMMPDYPHEGGYRENSLCFRVAPPKTKSEGGEVAKGEFSREGSCIWIYDGCPKWGDRAFQRTALDALYERMVLGMDLPAELVLTGVGVQEVVATALFITPDLALAPYTPALIYAASLWARWGPHVAAAHMHPDHYVVLSEAVKEAMENPNNYQSLVQGATIIETYLRTGMIDALLRGDTRDKGDIVEILEVAPPFVVFKGGGDSGQSIDMWQSIYSQGFLCGIWVGPGQQKIIFKKSTLVPHFDAPNVRDALNRAEFGGDTTEGDNAWGVSPDLTLVLPPSKNILTDPEQAGTTLGWGDILKILTRK